MKNKLIIIGIIIFTILINTITIYALTENNVIYYIEKNEIKAGEIFKVTIKIEAPDGINGLVTKYNYDTEKLELIEGKILDSTNFTELGGTENEITIMFNPEDPNNFTPITQNDIYELTFKLKDEVENGNAAKINFEKTYLSVLNVKEPEYNLSEQEITITAINENKTNINYGNKVIYILIGIATVIVILKCIKSSKRKK